MKPYDLLLCLKDNQYYFALERVVGPKIETWLCRPAASRDINAVRVALNLTEFQILAAPKKKYLAMLLPHGDTHWCFKDYDNYEQAVRDGPNDLQMHENDSYVIAEHKIVNNYWVYYDLRWYIATDAPCSNNIHLVKS